MDWSPPGSSVNGISQARILQWVYISFSRGSSWPRDRTCISRLAGGFFTIWATREAPYMYTIIHMQIHTLYMHVYKYIYMHVYDRYTHLKGNSIPKCSWWLSLANRLMGLCQVLAMARGIFHLCDGICILQLQHAGSFSCSKETLSSSSLTRNRTWAPCIGSMDS